MELANVQEFHLQDSKTLNVCHNRRIHSHKVFQVISEYGKI
ncbi:hypothetical protein GT715_16005 [Clostridium beijerinckii]|uniref:Transposase n=1 Tax=Candidatus Clostridium helianthi TaxID=3381660 RepID=A0ABW8S6Z3_9CLOT|nr:hypothetical protein [Clostridium beijerinckii]MZK60676.1 hypothetical protein [Clostridium beijerinckii]MZK70951.1 hypothetical protein [Clostridium beijerinckii]MZK76304.1 hypothetical protein [Clostridium beijerinckii]MZK86006.1 hypothetical protein [Clostridium beijerinckii]